MARGVVWEKIENMSERPLIRCFLAGKAPGAQLCDYLAVLSRFNSSVSSVGPDEADFVFVSHHPKSIREALSVPERGQIRVFIGSEAIFPDMNLLTSQSPSIHPCQANEFFDPKPLFDSKRSLNMPT